MTRPGLPLTLIAVFLLAAEAAPQTPAAASPSPQASPSPASQAAAGSRPRPCTAPKYRHFDFWIGEWDVMGADGTFAGTNRITAVDGGCALLENWSSAGGGYTGRSLNSLGLDRKWHQTWVDSSGLRLELTGELKDTSMVLEGETPALGPQQPAALNRITWTPQSPDLVRQRWETSTDLGKNWTTVFDGMYHRIAGPATPPPSFMDRLSGGWIGQGQLIKRDSHAELSVEAMPGQSLFALRWRNVVMSDPRGLFEGFAVYAAGANGDFNADWWDSGGARYAIKATAAGSAMTAWWGDQGRTVYTLREDGDLEVVDSRKAPDGSWSEFGRVILKRK